MLVPTVWWLRSPNINNSNNFNNVNTTGENNNNNANNSNGVCFGFCGRYLFHRYRYEDQTK
ncbi:MAG: hypothetical protein IKA52_05470 [Bacteroidaceae bacterium]|nr:hypothetical protein [Bacteroidaceae bacterium]